MFALLPFLGEEKINRWHRKYRNHHSTWINKDGEVVRKSPDQIN